MNKNKARKKLVSRAIPRKVTFSYTSVCCEAPATKPPVERKAEDKTANEYSQCGLGKWHCNKCGKNCKVKRSKITEIANGNDTGS
jgi:hypothetical protein